MCRRVCEHVRTVCCQQILTLQIRSATQQPHTRTLTSTQPDSGGTTSSWQETPRVPWQPMEHNGSSTAGNNGFICCKVALSPKSLPIILPPTSFHSLPLSPFCGSLLLCNHNLYTIGSQSNLMHRYSLIKLICRDPLLPVCPPSMHVPHTKTHIQYIHTIHKKVTLNYFPVS